MTAYVDVFGDRVMVIYQNHNHMWMSPAHGQQFAAADDAMHAELEAYMDECGEDVESDAIQTKIDNYIVGMRQEN